MFRRLFCLLFVTLFVSFSFGSNIEWQNKTLNFKAEPTDEKIDASFHFSVKNKPLTIKTIRSSCGCTTAKLAKKTYQPGEEGIIEVIFDLGGRIGKQRKFVMLETDDPESPNVQLELNVYIPQVLKIEPRFVYWTKENKPYDEKIIDLSFDIPSPIRIVSVTSDKTQLQPKLIQTSDSSYQISIRPEIPENEAPFFRAVIKIEVDADFELKQRVFYAYAFMKS